MKKIFTLLSAGVAILSIGITSAAANPPTPPPMQIVGGDGCTVSRGGWAPAYYAEPGGFPGYILCPLDSSTQRSIVLYYDSTATPPLTVGFFGPGVQCQGTGQTATVITYSWNTSSGFTIKACRMM